MRLFIGLILAICVGISCRWFSIPLPGPSAIMGSILAVGMASGYTATDYFLSHRQSKTQPETASLRANDPVSPLEIQPNPLQNTLQQPQARTAQM